MLSLRGLKNLLACLVAKTPRVFKAELYDSYISRGESAFPPVRPVNKCMSFRVLRTFPACLVFYKKTCILGTGQ